MVRRLAAGLALVLAACGGSDGSTGSSAATDSIVVVDSGPLDTAPEAAADTTPEAAPDTADTGDGFDAPPVCSGGEPEPNDSIAEAVPLSTIDDCDSSGSTFSGELSNAGDVDYWHYQGNDTFGCTVDATASTKMNVKLCVFIACLHGATRINGCTKGTPMESESGFHGCCTDGPGDVVVDHTCTLVGSDDSADVYMRVEDPSSTSICAPYDVSYHF